MVLSMTGFGSAKSESELGEVTAEVKSLNSKYMDISIRLPRVLSHREGEIRNMVSKNMKRGKVSVSVELKINPELSGGSSIDKGLFKRYFDELTELAKEVNTTGEDIFRLALHMPDVIQSGDNKVEDDAIWKIVREAIEAAMEKAKNFRKEEGGKLETQLKANSDHIAEFLETIKGMEGQRMEAIREKIKKNLEELSDDVQIDKNRYEQEVVFYLERLDIQEEVVRLKSHITYFNETLSGKESNGKRLNFLSQEMGREINTIGAKANHAEIQRTVVNMKEDLEQIREQVQNLL